MTTRLLFFTWFLAAIALVLCGVSWGCYLQVERQLQAHLYQQLAAELAPAQRGQAEPDLTWPAVGPSDMGRLASHGICVRYYDLKGTRRLEGGVSSGRPRERPELIQQLLTRRTGSLRYTSSLEGKPWQMWALPVREAGAWVGVLEVGTSLQYHHQVLRILGQTLLWGAALGAGVSAAMAALLSLYLGRPVEVLAGVMSRVRGGDLSARARPTGPQEMRRMAAHLNAMIADLESLLEGQRRFIANASHELKTPLTSLSAMCELLHQRDAELTSERRERAWRVVERELAQIANLVQDLLLLSRLELSPADPSCFDPLEVLGELQEHYAEAGRVEFQVSPPPLPQAIRGDAEGFQRVVRNLLENALQQTPEGGRIQLTLEHGSTGWTLQVRDQGAGIEPELLSRVGEPFFRTDASRSRRSGGTGLGLSIVAAWVVRHKGRWSIVSGPELGEWATRVTLQLPSESLQEHAIESFSQSG